MVRYTGAPYYASMAALRTGTDLVHIFCEGSAAPTLKAYSPELIVHPYLSSSGAGIKEVDLAQRLREKVFIWLDRYHTLLIGPGLTRDPKMLWCAGQILHHYTQPGVLIDAVSPSPIT